MFYLSYHSSSHSLRGVVNLAMLTTNPNNPVSGDAIGALGKVEQMLTAGSAACEEPSAVADWWLAPIAR